MDSDGHRLSTSEQQWSGCQTDVMVNDGYLCTKCNCSMKESLLNREQLLEFGAVSTFAGWSLLLPRCRMARRLVALDSGWVGNQTDRNITTSNRGMHLTEHDVSVINHRNVFTTKEIWPTERPTVGIWSSTIIHQAFVTDHISMCLDPNAGELTTGDSGATQPANDKPRLWAKSHRPRGPQLWSSGKTLVVS